jgi:Holliday junction resolvasome RuvABC DNA-binding subunit
LLIELRDRLKTAPSEQATSSGVKTPIQDAISALMTLGYKESDASRAVRSIESAEGSAVEALIKEALRVLAKGSA